MCQEDRFLWPKDTFPLVIKSRSVKGSVHAVNRLFLCVSLRLTLQDRDSKSGGDESEDRIQQPI